MNSNKPKNNQKRNNNQKQINKIKHVKIIFLLLVILTIILIYIYYNFILKRYINKNEFIDQMVEISDQSEKNIFSIEKIQLHSNANYIDKSKDNSLSDVNVSQYTDIAIYINNSGESNDITNENTIKKLYIDNIKIEPKIKKDNIFLNYKNSNKLGLYQEIAAPENNRIDFKIINTNEENDKTNYDEPEFYADCSNPITLEYLNKNILTNYSVEENPDPTKRTLTLNGKVLNETGINVDNLESTISFTIHLVTNENHGFAYNMKLNLKHKNINDPNNSITNGSFTSSTNPTGIEYKFMSELIH